MLIKKTKKRKISFPVPLTNIIGLFLSSFTGIIVISILTFVISTIISKSSNYPSYTEIYFCLCIGLGSLISGYFAAKKCNFKGLISGFICSFLTILFITIIMLFFTNGQLNEKTIILYLIIVICSTLGGIISANTKKR